MTEFDSRLEIDTGIELEGDSPLDKAVALADIIDPDSLQRVCMTFSRLYETGVTVLDGNGHALVDIPAEHPLCLRVASHPNAAHLSCSFDNLGGTRDTDTTVCACGLRYQILPIAHQGEVLGKVVLGPYRPTGLDDVPASLRKLLGGDAAPEELLSEIAADLRRMKADSPDRARNVVNAINDVLSVIVHTGYARHLTSQIHVAAIQEAYNELTEKNRRLADSVERLKELDKLKSSFLATVSHELRTPLTSVIGYSEMLLEGLAGDMNEDQTSYVRTIMEKGDQLLQIINEILDISKLESGSVQLVLEHFSVAELLEQIRDGIVPMARRSDIEIELQVAEDLPELKADRGKARQLILNLVSNAIKFTPSGGQVQLSAALDGIAYRTGEPIVPVIEFRIRDTGIGVKQENRDKIFEAFYQVDNSSTRQYGGTGLGLSIVKHFVEAHGGRVWVEDPTEGQGSVFVVQMPVDPPADTLAAKSQKRLRKHMPHLNLK